MATEEEIINLISGHNIRNTALLKSLDGRILLKELRKIEHHFISKNQTDAAHLAKTLYDCGYLINMIAPFEMDDKQIIWSIDALKNNSPIDVSAQSFMKILVRLAAQYDSIYDGWGTSI